MQATNRLLSNPLSHHKVVSSDSPSPQARARRHVQGILVRAAFSEWRGLVCVSAHAREVMRSTSERLQQRGLLRAFRGWREAVAELQRQRAIMQRAAGHIMHSALAQVSAHDGDFQVARRSERSHACLHKELSLVSSVMFCWLCCRCSCSPMSVANAECGSGSVAVQN